MKSRSPVISVVVPSYNYARYLPHCINSVTSQSHEELELILIDDRSTDNSIELLNEIVSSAAFADRFSGRVHLEVNSRNLGAHETINRGIAAAHGDYVCILNADDTFGEDRLKTMLGAMQSASARFSFSRVAFINDAGETFAQHDPLVHQLKRRQSSIAKYPTVGFACLASNVAISTGNFMFERQLFRDVGAFRNLRYCHDWDFLLRALLLTEPLYIESAIYNYRIHGANTFRSLQSIAESESALVYREYFEKIVSRSQRNKYAPSPPAWPGVFDAFMTTFGLWPHWVGGLPDVA